MRIAQIAPPYLPVPPSGYGGIEKVVAALADGLAERGHEVTLFASGGSNTKAALVSPLADAPGPENLGENAFGLSHSMAAHSDEGEFDIIHDHTLEGPALGALRGHPALVHTLHGPWTPATREYYGRLDRVIHLVAISETQRGHNPDVQYAATVPNGVDVSVHPFRDDKEDFLVYIGRATPDKGPAQAIQVAERAGKPLALVLKMSEPQEQEFWRSEVRPLVTDSVEVFDHVEHDQKVDLLGRACAMVFPIQWPEPFGLVMTEAMACGTPVITRPLGAAKELVVDGVTGYLRETLDELAAAVDEVGALNPKDCRQWVAERYSTDAMVDGYEALFERILASSDDTR
ncbi:MAG: glycosyltransferase family 4 protein [Actinomycetota bacterium]|nr:glycosyltransferase family 4 protein [Actinomycetota bacterium]